VRLGKPTESSLLSSRRSSRRWVGRSLRQMGGRYSSEEWLGSFRMLLTEFERLEAGAKDGERGEGAEPCVGASAMCQYLSGCLVAEGVDKSL
jgi:hypothetical protein